MKSTAYWIFVISMLLSTSNLFARPPAETQSLSTGSVVATWSISPAQPKYKTPILYLHGGPGMYTEDRRITDGQIFRDLGFITLYFDQAGGGQSEHIPASEYTIERAVSDLEALRVSLGHEKLILWGNSYGATLAAIYTARYPDRVAALIFTSPGAFPGTKPKRNYKVTARSKIKPSKSVKKALQVIDKIDPDDEKKLNQTEAGLIFDELLNSGMMGGMICKTSKLKAGPLTGGGNFYANRRIPQTLKDLAFDRNKLPKIPSITLRGACDFHHKDNAQIYADAFGGSLVEIEANGHGLMENRQPVERALRDFGESIHDQVE